MQPAPQPHRLRQKPLGVLRVQAGELLQVAGDGR
jgi:hypothetical protein